jgi:hypothetical protein
MSKGTAGAALHLALFAATAWAASALFGPAYAQVKSFATYTVDKVKAAGNLEVDFTTIAKDGTEIATFKTIKVEGTDTPADVAKKIAEAFGGKKEGFVNNGAKVEYDVGASGNKAAGLTGQPNNVAGFTIDTEGRVALLPPPDTRVAELAFLPNPSNGSDMLATPSMITAGFASGLAPVSFDAPASISSPRCWYPP